MDRIHPWPVAAPLLAGDVAPALTSPRGTAALGPRGASSIPSPAEGKVKVYQGFCRGLTGPSAFYRLFKQLTSINQNGAGSVRSGEGRKSLLGSRGKESPVGTGCCGGLGTARALRMRGLPPLTTFPISQASPQHPAKSLGAIIIHLPTPNTARDPAVALPCASPEPNPGFGWAQGDPATIQPQPHASPSPAQGDTDRKSHQHRRSLVPSGEARRWAEAFQFQNDCVEGGRIEMSPKNKAALSLGKTDGHTDPLGV